MLHAPVLVGQGLRGSGRASGLLHLPSTLQNVLFDVAEVPAAAPGPGLLLAEPSAGRQQEQEQRWHDALGCQPDYVDVLWCRCASAMVQGPSHAQLIMPCVRLHQGPMLTVATMI